MAVSFAPAPEGAGDSEGHTAVMLLFYGGLFAIFYFLLIRPQSKKTKETQNMQSELSKGDNVITSGGIYGSVYKIKDDVVTLQVADDVRMKFQRSAISERLKESDIKDSDD